MFGIQSMAAARLDVAIRLLAVDVAGAAAAHAGSVHLAAAQSLLDEARTALTAGNVEQGWQCQKAAARALFHHADLGGLESEAQALIATAKDATVAMTTWRGKAILATLEPLFAAGAPARTTAILAPLVVAARKTLDDYHDANYLRLAALRGRLGWISAASAVALLVWLVAAPLSIKAAAVDVKHGFIEKVAAAPWMFWASVMLAGVLGSLISAFTTAVGAGDARTKIPQEISAVAITMARLLLAALSATALIVFVLSGLQSVVNASYELILALAIVAGFSDRMLMAALEKAK